MKRLLPGILLAGALASVPCARGAGMATNRWVRAAGKDARASVAENWSLGPGAIVSVTAKGFAPEIGRASCRERVCQYV